MKGLLILAFFVAMLSAHNSLRSCQTNLECQETHYCSYHEESSKKGSCLLKPSNFCEENHECNEEQSEVCQIIKSNIFSIFFN